MSKSAGIMKSSAMLSLARILSSACAFVLFWYISQTAIDQLGAFRTIFVFFLLSEFLPLLGMNQYLIREVSISECGVVRHLLHAMLFALLISLVMVLAFILMARFGNYSVTVSSGLTILAFGMPATAITLCFQSVLVGLGDSSSFGVLQAAETVARTLAGLALLFLGQGVLSIVVAIVVIRWLFLAIYWKRIAPCCAGERWAFHNSYFAGFLKQIPSFAGILCLFLVSRFAAQTALPWVKGDVAAGFFAVAYQFLDLVLLLPTALVITLMPVFAQKAKAAPAQMAEACEQSIRIVLLVVTPCVVLLTVMAEPIILLIFKQNYLPAVPVLQILIWLALLFSMDRIFSTAAIASGHQRIDLICLAIGAGLILVLLALLMPWQGVTGAAWALLLGALGLIACRILLSRPFLPGLNLPRQLLRPLASAGVMALVLYARPLHWMFASLLAGAAYLLAFCLLGGFRRQEREQMASLLRAKA